MCVSLPVCVVCVYVFVCVCAVLHVYVCMVCMYVCMVCMYTVSRNSCNMLRMFSH